MYYSTSLSTKNYVQIHILPRHIIGFSLESMRSTILNVFQSIRQPCSCIKYIFLCSCIIDTELTHFPYHNTTTISGTPFHTYRLYSPGIFTGPANGTPPPQPPPPPPPDVDDPRILAAMRVAMLSVPLQLSEPPSGSHEPARMSTFRSLMFDVRSASDALLAIPKLFSPPCCSWL